MLISEICIKRPVFATVLNLIVITLGLIFFTKLQIRGIPNIDPPIINVSTSYPGADGLIWSEGLPQGSKLLLRQ